MTELDQVIRAAFQSEGKQEDVNKVHLTFLRSVLFLPIKKEKTPGNDEPFEPLFVKEEDKYFMPIFDTDERLTTWAGDQLSHMNYVEITGRDLIQGVGEKVYVCLNVGTECYKEFSPDEVNHLKKVVARIESLRTKQ
jgi:hypothetical protein